MHDELARNTTGLIDRMFNELDLLHRRKITPTRARAAAAIGAVIVDAAQIEVSHHRMRPRRNGKVFPVQLGGNVIEGVVLERSVKALPRKRKPRR